MSMISQVRHLDENPSRFEWDLSLVDGTSFEMIVQAVVRRELRDVEGCLVWPTAKTKDRGKDIVLEFVNKIDVLGCALAVPREQQAALAHIEIKKLNAATLSANDFGGSLMQLHADDRKPAYFILVTNATLTPATLHHATQEFEARGCKFLLVDRVRLARRLFDCSEGLALPLPKQRPSPPAIAVSYCTQNIDELSATSENVQPLPNDAHAHRGKSFALFVAMHNYSDEERTIRLALRSDVNWGIEANSIEAESSAELTFYLDPRGYKTTKLRLTQQSFEALDELRIALEIDGRPRTLEIRGPQIEFEFDPPLFGAAHLACAQGLTDDIGGRRPPDLISMHGKAGAGKSRVLSEVRKRLAGRHVFVVGAELRPGREKKVFSNIFKQVAAELALDASIPTDISAIELIQRIAGLPRIWDHYVIVLEDIHHASKSVFDDLRSYCNLGNGGSVTIIVTGRDDGTVANTHYFSFIDQIAQMSIVNQGNVQVRDIPLNPWSDSECKQFIRLTIEEVPVLVVERVHALSENTPFGVVQAIQYLLDLSIVEVVNRNTVGVINAERLAAKNCIPEGLQELIERRIQYLALDGGNRAQVILNVLALLGPELPELVFQSIFPDENDHVILRLIQKRHFIDATNGKLRFTHENLQIHFLSRLEGSAGGKLAAEVILASPIALSDLSVQRRAYLNFVAGCFEQAFADLSYLFGSVEHISNISSVDIEAGELSNIRPLTEAAIALGKPVLPIARLCILESYLSLHNQPLALALESCTRLEATVERIPLDPTSKELSLMEVRQLRAHIMLNMGHVLAAQKSMVEITARAALNPAIEKNSRLMFDCYDRLQNIYHQLNHKKMFLYYSELSGNAAALLGDQKLQALVIASRVKEHYFDNPEEYLRQTQIATAVALKSASARHICHAELNLCIAELMCSEKPLSDLIARLSELLRMANEQAYSFSVTRAQLAIAVGYCLLGLHDETNRRMARRYADIGIESCIRFGNGFFLWQLHNLLAIIELSERDVKTTRAAGHFENAIHYLRKQGLLFVGCLDSCSPNLAVISNYIKFLDQHQRDRDTFKFVNSLAFYDKGIGDSRREAVELITSVRKFGLIGRTQPLPRPLIERTSGFLLALR